MPSQRWARERLALLCLVEEGRGSHAIPEVRWCVERGLRYHFTWRMDGEHMPRREELALLFQVEEGGEHMPSQRSADCSEGLALLFLVPVC